MGLLAGALASGVGNAAGQVVSNSQAELDLQNAQQMAKYKSGLDQDREAAAARLQQQLHTETALSTANGPIADAANAGARTREASEAATFNDASTGVAQAAEAKASVGPVHLGPGVQLYEKQPDGTRKQTAENTNMTNADARALGYTGGAGGNNRQAGIDAKQGQFDAKQVADGLKGLTATVMKTYVAPGQDGKSAPITTATEVAKSVYTAAIATGRSPEEASSIATTAVETTKQEAQALLAKEGPRGPLKGDLGDAMALAVQQRTARAAAPAPANPQPSAAPAQKPPILKDAMAPTPSAPSSDATGDAQLAKAAAAAGYKASRGNDGKNYYTKQGPLQAGEDHREILTEKQIAEKLNLVR